MSDDIPPGWFVRNRAATTSWTRFRVLELAVEERVTAASVARTLDCDPKASARHLRELKEAGLVVDSRGGGYVASAHGELFSAHLRAAEGHPAAQLAGRRILGIRYGSGGRSEVRDVLARDAEFVLRADGDLDLIAVLPDDADLSADLQSALRESNDYIVRARLTIGPAGELN